MDYILENIQDDGMLASEFCVNIEYEKNRAKSEIKFVDGFSDGGMMYHCATNEQDAKPLFEVLHLISNKKFEEAQNLLDVYFCDMQSVDTLSIIDDVQKWIYDNSKELNASNIANFSFHMLSLSRNIEAIKFSLSLLELFDLSDMEECRIAIKNLALCNEFTLFCIFAINSWPDKNELIFEMAQKVRGWGRVFAIARLEPETEAIKKWLLDEGQNNEILDEYSALEIANKINIAELVKDKNITNKTYKNLGKLISNLLTEGPVAGISALDNKDDVIEQYLLRAAEQKNDIRDYEIIYNILEYIHGLNDNPKQYHLKQLCGALLVTVQCKKTIEKALEEGDGFYLAKNMQMNYYEAALKCIKKDPLKHINLLELVLNDDTDNNNKVIDLYTQILPLDKIATGPEDIIGFGHELSTDILNLSSILSQLFDRPGLGEKLLICALNSLSTQNRNSALNVIENWRDKKLEISVEVKSALQKLKKVEVNEKLKERLRNF